MLLTDAGEAQNTRGNHECYWEKIFSREMGGGGEMVVEGEEGEWRNFVDMLVSAIM